MHDSAKTFNGTIEFYRYIFTVVVCLMHLYYNFWGLGDLFGGGYISVDFFFVLSGYFLPAACVKHQTAAKYTFMRYVGMFFYVISASLLGVLLASNGHLEDIPSLLVSALPDMLCLQMSGIFYLKSLGVMWYISAMVIAGFFISNLYYYNGSKKKFIGLIGPAIVLIGYALIFHSTGNLDSVGQEGFILPLGLIRALAGMSLGVIVSQLSIEIKGWKNDVLQMFSFGALFTLVYFQHHTRFDFLALILVPILILTMQNPNTKINSITDKIGRMLSKRLGRQFTLSMYIYSTLIYAFMGIIIDFVSIGRFLSAIIYLPTLFVFSFIMNKFSIMFTPKFKALIQK